MKRASNRLTHETSPYLLQHAHNPVDWYAWGEEALARARSEDKPILLSIGYAACHWCHVMERESFENDAIAALMNQHFVCIKVDREERPDLDDVYMAATTAMTGRGGWPMTVFLLPDQRPFFAGTYFPPEDRYGRPGFPSLLTRIAEVFRDDRVGVEQQAAQLTEAVRTQLQHSAPASVSHQLIDHAAAQLKESYDERYGGFGGAPKFPASSTLRLLLRTRSTEAQQMVLGTLDGMKNGGMYDHVGGGFARYSTDERWHVPHFEKMLYDNAQLVRAYLEGYQVSGDREYRRVAEETLDYVVREMQSADGGFYSATDADSEGVEGKFFTFSEGELAAVLPEPLRTSFCAYYDVTAEGNWEHSNVLWTPRTKREIAAQLSLSIEQLDAQLNEAKARVYEARKQRVPPLVDDKILTSWNGLMIGALAEGGRVLRRADYVRAAQRCADFLLNVLKRPDGGLFRTARHGKAQLAGYLEDYAYLGDALIDLYEAGADERYLRAADALCTRMVADFRDPQSGDFYQTAHSHETLIARTRSAQDDALPDASAIAAQLCARLAVHLDKPELRAIAQRTVESFGQLLPRAPRAFASMLLVLDFLTREPVQVAIVGSETDPQREALERALAELYLPNRCLAHHAGEGTSTLPLLAGKGLTRAGATAYVCEGFSCQVPTSSPAQLRDQLRDRTRAGEATG